MDLKTVDINLISLELNADLDRDSALSQADAITIDMNKIISNKLDAQDYSGLPVQYRKIYNIYARISERFPPESMAKIRSVANYWNIMANQIETVKGIDKLEKDYIENSLINYCNSATGKIRILGGECGFLKRSPKLRKSIINAANTRGVDVSIYCTDIPDELYDELKGNCKIELGNEYSKHHYWLIDDVVYEHFHPRDNDKFLLRDEHELKMLKDDFEKLTRNQEQSSFVDGNTGIIYEDDAIIEILTSKINSAKKEIIIASGLGVLLQKSPELVESIITAKKQRNVDVRLYYVYISDEKLKTKLDTCIKTYAGKIYPRKHYWVIDDFIYESDHPRRKDVFIKNERYSSKLNKNFDKLIRHNT